MLRAWSHAPPIRVVLADDGYLIREAITHLLEGVAWVTVAGECDDARAVVSSSCERRP
jgi:DNA-binding NarL/FixJ family response regulator